ncbi:4a-hydroxytetrahydrobiopterin dehydratase [Gordonia sp. (in: high G+C Gram-positive bacteria)]|uniref:4a-hydroxytetrahydrobiopterin dehydratase n=1 Tax=Gordonia sp. (in: high G+C Gram-positive bacteria) TaxID=84139 RepID=UPI0039E4682B
MTARRYRPLAPEEAAALAPAPWHVVDGRFVAAFRPGSMVRGLEFVSRIVAAAEALDHHPDIDFRYATVALELSTHAIGGLSDADVDLATTISGIADELGVAPA